MRRLFAIGLGLIVWGSVAACAHQMDQAAAGAMTWNLHMADGEAKLAYGPPNSDLVGLMLSCRRGTGSVPISGDVPADRPILVPASGASRLRLSGPAEADPHSSGLFLQASAPSSDPTLRRFTRTGDLRLVRALDDAKLDAPAAAKGDIRRFFAHCNA
jgi:hypothetical protein